jgi:hypothetical protein
VPPSRDSSLDCLAPAAGDEGTEIDLGDTFLEPKHLAGLAAAAHRLRRRGPVRVHGPRESEKAHYAARMRVGRALDAVGVRHDLARVQERDRSGELLEVTLLRTADDARRLAALVHAKVAPTDAQAAEALWEGLTELGENVQDHAAAGARDSSGFCAAQTMPTNGDVLFAVADSGVGLLSTLLRRGARNDREAIVMALAGTSRLDDAGRGRGLRTTLDMVSGLGGHLYVGVGARQRLRHLAGAGPPGGGDRLPGHHRAGLPPRPDAGGFTLRAAARTMIRTAGPSREGRTCSC